MAPKKNHKKKPKGPASERSAQGNDDGNDGDVGPETAAELKDQANSLVKAGEHAQARSLLTRAIGMKPADAHLYYSNRSLCALSRAGSTPFCTRNSVTSLPLAARSAAN